MDRLLLDEERVQGIINALESIAELDDPIGEILEEWDRPNGLLIQKVSVPLGVIGIIYESRPNVTADAAALCLKSGNAVILRGGSESFYSNTAIHESIKLGLGYRFSKAYRINSDSKEIIFSNFRHNKCAIMRL